MTPPPATGAAPRTVAPARRPAGAAPRTVAPARFPAGPRRVSGPARRPAPLPPQPPLRRLVDHPLLDRLIRGRTWIPIIAFALFGIVGMQVALLKLNSGIGRSVARAAVLERENSLLSAQVSALRAGDLRQAEAARQGMVYAPPGDVRYLTAGGRAVAAQAASAIVPPRLLAPPARRSLASARLGGATPTDAPTGVAGSAVAAGASGVSRSRGSPAHGPAAAGDPPAGGVLAGAGG